MSIRKVSFVEGEYYHIYNRGVNKNDIFLDNEDRDRFIKLLYLCNSTRKVNFRDDIVDKKIDAWDYDRENEIISIGAWVLMSNHFHLYLTIPRTTTIPKGNSFGKEKSVEKYDINGISTFMKKLCTSYTMYFNKKYSRSGSLFENKFKSVHIKDERQAKYLLSYIHLNPIKLIQSDWKDVGIKNTNMATKYLDNYKFSSYLEYKNNTKRKEGSILNIQDFPIYFSSNTAFENEIIEWLTAYKQKE